jgi:hypothetical protein
MQYEIELDPQEIVIAEASDDDNNIKMETIFLVMDTGQENSCLRQT